MNGAEPVQVAAGIIRRDGRILCCQRKKSSRYGLLWEFPGGKILESESAGDCLKRELMEELSITPVSMLPYLSRVASYPDNGIFHVHFFLIDEFSGDVKNRVFESIRWLFPNEFDDYSFLEGNAPVLRKLQREFRP